MTDLIIFTGHCPRNVNRDAKYGIRWDEGEWAVGLLYRTPEGEEWHATTKAHPDLVEKVNAVKVGVGSSPGGPFYINEHGQVIVPTGSDDRYYLADDSWEGLLEFDFEGSRLTGMGIDPDGRPLEPGDLWTGPHPGIPYVLRAGGGDVYYRSHPRTRVTRQEWLSTCVGSDAAKIFAARIQAVKGWSGGRFYVNEWRQIFAPVEGAEGWEYRYIGHLELDSPWFPKPEH